MDKQIFPSSQDTKPMVEAITSRAIRPVTGHNDYGELQVHILKNIGGCDLVTVSKCLDKVSIHWYNIGLHLRVPKEKLDQIEKDYRDTCRQNIQMIDAWICNCEECTWIALATVLRNLGYINAANLIASNDPENEPNDQVQEKVSDSSHSPEIGIEKNEIFQNGSSKLDNSNQAQREDYIKFNSDMMRVKKEGEEILEDLRKALNVPESISDESMWSNIQEYTSRNVNSWNEYEKIAPLITKFTEKVYHEQEVLQGRAHELSESVGQTCLLLRRHALHEEAQKLHLPISTLKSKHTQNFTELRNGEKSEDQTVETPTENKPTIHGNFLYNALENCLDHVHSKRSQNQKIRMATDTFKKVCKSILFMNMLRTLASLYVMIGALIVLWSTTSYTAMITAIAVSLAIALECGFQLTTNYMIGDYILTLLAGALKTYRNHQVRRIACALAGASTGIILTVHLTLENAVKLSGTMVIQFMAIELSQLYWVVGASVGFVSVVVLIKLIDFTRLHGGSLCFILTLPYRRSLLYVNTYVMGGFNMGLLTAVILSVMETNLVEEGLSLLMTYFLGIILPFLGGGGTLGLYAGFVLGQMGAVVGAALCGLQAVKSWKLVYFNIEQQMVKADKYLTDTSKQLTLTNKMLDKAKHLYQEHLNT